MIPTSAAVPLDGLGSSPLAALLAPITIVGASVVLLTLVMLLVGLVSEARDLARRRRHARTSDGRRSGRGGLIRRAA